MISSFKGFVGRVAKNFLEGQFKKNVGSFIEDDKGQTGLEPRVQGVVCNFLTGRVASELLSPEQGLRRYSKEELDRMISPSFDGIKPPKGI